MCSVRTAQNVQSQGMEKETKGYVKRDEMFGQKLLG